MDIENKYGALEVQKNCLSILHDFDLYCKQYDIKYSLAYGTLLGAVRHNGFIPWDDDIDVMLTRPNYDKFLHCFREHPMKGYTLIGKKWIKRLTIKDNPMINTESQCMDFFVLDIVPKNRLMQRIKVLLLKMLQGMIKDDLQYQNFSLKYKFLSFVAHVMGMPFTKEMKQKLYYTIMQWDGGCGGDELSVYNTAFQYMGLTFSNTMVSDYIDLFFENKNYMAISGFDEFLKVTYGDYMVPPPESDRKPRHS